MPHCTIFIFFMVHIIVLLITVVVYFFSPLESKLIEGIGCLFFITVLLYLAQHRFSINTDGLTDYEDIVPQKHSIKHILLYLFLQTNLFL